MEFRQIKRKPKRKRKKADTSENESVSSQGQQKKLKELDEFIDGVLQEAGEDFLDEFKQVEGE